ncbi:MAG: CbiX/SirB N-terminal domain-containing protein [Planctomycetota bacterium]
MTESESTVPWQKLALDDKAVGIVVVDHGSRRAESNALLLEVVAHYEQQSPFSIIEPAHMELAEPSLGDAFDRCVERGASMVVVHPYFLLPGRHWNGDIPQLAAEAAERHPGVRYLVTAPLGLHPLMAKVMQARIEQCLQHAVGDLDACDLCQGTDKCQFRGGEAS